MTLRTSTGRARAHRAVRFPVAPVCRAARSAVEALESRRLMAANPSASFVAIADFSTSSANKTNKGVSYYDVSTLADPTGKSGVFGQAPAFTIWMGFEGTAGGGALSRNAEEISAITVNPINGDTYVLAFDSVAAPALPGDPDPVGDTQGDYDLYRYNFAAAYNDYTTRLAAWRANPATNPNPRGLMYTDIIAPDGFNYQTRYAAGGYAVDGADDGIPLARSNKDADTTNDIVFLDGLVEKIGEVARIQSAASRFFGETNADTNGDNEGGQDIQFVDPNTLIISEQTNTDNDIDYSVRVLKRISLTPNSAPGTLPVAATVSIRDFVGGTNALATGVYAEAPLGTPLTTESWISQTIDTDPTAADSGGLFYNLELPAVQSNADGLRYVEQDGIKGVWISERAPTTTFGTPPTPIGGHFAFWQLDLGPATTPTLDPFAPTATKRQVTLAADPANPTPLTVDVLTLAEDPQANARTDDGELDWFDVDENGDLVIAEKSSVGDATAAEPKLISLDVTQYNTPTLPPAPPPVQLGAFTTHPNLAPTSDDDAAVTDGRFGVYERGQNYAYYFDQDGAGAQDVYVYDLDTNQLVYQELDATNHGMDDANQIRAFTLGDYANAAGPVTSANDVDGVAGASDIDALYARVTDPTAGGLYPASIGKELFDLSGDGNVTTADVDSLVRKVLHTQYGDANLNGQVGPEDFNLLASNFGLAGGWGKGNFNGDASVGPEDFNLLASNFGFNAPGDPPPPPVIAATVAAPVTSTVATTASKNTSATKTTAARTLPARTAGISTASRTNVISRTLRG